MLTAVQRASRHERGEKREQKSRTPMNLKEANRKKMPIILTSTDQRLYTNIQKYTD